MSNVFVIIKMCYVHNQWYDISCSTLYLISFFLECTADSLDLENDEVFGLIFSFPYSTYRY